MTMKDSRIPALRNLFCSILIDALNERDWERSTSFGIALNMD